MTHKECDTFLASVLEIGRRLVETGAEIHRVEDTVSRICSAYGLEGCDVYAVTGMIVATVCGDDGFHYTQTVEELKHLVFSYKKPKPKPVIKCLGYMLAAGGFAVFFGGSWFDGIASAAVAIAIYLMDYNLKLRNVNNVIYTFVASFVSGCIAILFVHFGFGTHIDKVMIGDIMLFIPGLLLVSAVKEMFNRDIVTGQ